MRSAIFYSEAHHDIETKVRDFINSHPAFLSAPSLETDYWKLITAH